MSFDVAIVGLGTAGSAAAALCARAGLRVVGLDVRSLDQAGATWCNGVPGWAFDEVGLARPEGPELHAGEGSPFHVIAGWGPTRVTTTSVLDVDMRHLVQRLQRIATEHGADLRGEQRVTDFDGQVLRTATGPIRATTYVDASGLSGLQLLAGDAVDRTDLCVAAQYVHEVADPQGAAAFLARHQGGPGQILCFTGVAGGYSILNVRVHGDQVSILTGSMPALGHQPGTRLLDGFVAEQRWIGARIFGGARAIPLGPPRPRIGVGNVALIGDSAGQVHSAHGSGIAQQLLAAGLLADTLVGGGTPEDYNVAWQRRYGGVLAGADRFRRFSQTLAPHELEAMIRREVLHPGLMADTLIQKPVRPSVGALLHAGRGLARLPRIAARLAPTVAAMKGLEWHYKRYPRDPARVPGWARRIQAS